MLHSVRRAVAASCAFLILAIAGAGTVRADLPGDRNPDTDRLPPDASRMYRYVKSPHPGELKWQQIPWLTDLGDAMRQARVEGRPLVLFVSGDEPLERC